MMNSKFRIRNLVTAAATTPARFRRQRGIALFITLMLLSIVSLLGLAMMLSVNSDMLINGYYGNFRSSFYAADSGLSIARQSLLNNIGSAENTTACNGWGSTGGTGCTADPLSTFNPSTQITNLKSTYSSFTRSSSSGSWPASFIVADTTQNGKACTNALTLVGGAPETLSNYAGGSLVNHYRYTYNYTLCVVGRSQSLQQSLVKETGAVLVDALEATNPPTTSFSAWGAFISNYSPNTGPLIPGTMEGPMFTNGAWQFMTGGQYIFTGKVQQVNSQFDYNFNGRWKDSGNPSYTYNGQTIAPTFQAGYQTGANGGVPLQLPSNDFSQQWAVLDGMGCGEGGTTCGGTTAPPVPAQSDMAAVLTSSTGTAYPSSGGKPTSGVYMPFCKSGSSGCSTPGKITGGGIFVAGCGNPPASGCSTTTNIVLSATTDSTTGDKIQTYTITQGSTVTTITMDPRANGGQGSTTMVTGTNPPQTLIGVPQDLVTGSGTPQDATMLYVDGKINSLKGTGQGVPAIQDGTQLTIAANGDVNITGDVVYAHEPVTMDTNDTLISGNNSNQVLGIYTNTGNIVLSSPYSNHNLQVDGSLAAIGNSCASTSCGFKVNGSINTFNNVGGQIQTNIFSASMQTENTWWDKRFENNFAPPWFPSTTVNTPGTTPAPVYTVTLQRWSWVNYPQ